MSHWLAVVLAIVSADEGAAVKQSYSPSLLVAQRRVAADDEPQIKLPISVTPPTPSAVTELSPDSFFVIESKIECLVIASRAGFVRTIRETGPLRLRGRFADGTGVETRNYTAPILWLVEAVSAGEVELLVVPSGATDERDVIRRTLVVSGLGPQPPPKPVDPPIPTPVDPPPIVQNGNRFLVIYETSEVNKLPPAQQAILTSTVLRLYLLGKCAVNKNLTSEMRFLDPDTEFTKDDQVWRDAMKLPRGPLPWLVVSNGRAGFSGPLPKTVDETLAICKRYFEGTP